MTTSKKSPEATTSTMTYEKFLDDQLTLTLPHDGLDIPPAVISVEIAYTGKEGVKEAFKENETLILDLIRTKAVGFSLKDLKGEGISRFEKEILASINGFVNGKKFIKVKVSKIKEI